MTDTAAPKRVGVGETFGRYFLYAPIARGGMATVHIARQTGAEGFSRIVAAKRIHQELAQDAEFLAMFLDEARIASKIHHPNVVPVLDVVHEGQEVILVQEYVHGVPLDRLLRGARSRSLPIPVDVTVAIAVNLLSGLHAAHETKDELGQPLDIVHRDISPQNILVGVDGAARVLDFGIAKAASSAHVTREGIFKGKVSYIAPEQLRVEPPLRTADLFALGVVLWEMLVGRLLHQGLGGAELFAAVLNTTPPLLTSVVDRTTVSDERWQQLVTLEPIIDRALSPIAGNRYPTAAEMLDAISLAVRPATPVEVGRWVASLGKEYIEARDKVIVAIEESWRSQSSTADLGSGPSSIPVLPDMVSGPRSVPALPPSPSSVPVPVAPIEHPVLIPVTHSEADMSAMRNGRLIWGLVLALLFAIAALTAVLVAALRPRDGGRRTSLPPEPQTALAEPAGATVTAPVVNTQAARAPAGTAAPGTAAPAPAVAEAPHPATTVGAAPEVARPALTWRQPVKATVHYTGAAPAQPSPAATTAAPAAAKPDPCDPPFYFEGTKKVYKAGCI